MEKRCNYIGHDTEVLTGLYHTCFGISAPLISQLAGAGSNRRYYRIENGNGETVIGTCGEDMKENRAFIDLARHFWENGLPVPQVLAATPDYAAYLQTFAGEVSVFDKLSSARCTGQYTDLDTPLLENAMKILARLQLAGRNLDYSRCYPRQEVDSRMVRWDLNYFKYCFLKPAGVEFNEDRLQDEFDLLEGVLLRDKDKWRTFIHRDYQSRNIMVSDDGRLTVIDFQGGRRGPGAYDVASFLWQAKARYPQWLREHLVGIYTGEMERLDSGFDRRAFLGILPWFVLFRILQTLGAYGFRGWVERKPHFLQSVTAGVDNLHDFVHRSDIAVELPYLTELSERLYLRWGSPSKIPYLKTLLSSDNTLTVKVTSFSFKKGIPEDSSGNGGGFVFDCRAPHNPGRYEPYKQQTGLDKPVRMFLENDGEIIPFIQECKRLVDASVERYIQRGFTSLAVNFGCTGGQHRSVYAADAMAHHLNDKYGVKVLVCHREQGISEELPSKDVEVEFDSFLKNSQKTYKQLL